MALPLEDGAGRRRTPRGERRGGENRDGERGEGGGEETPHRAKATLSSYRNEARAAWTRCAARCCVLSRANSAAIHAPCVLASHSPIAPGQRVIIPLEALSASAAG